MKDSSQAEKAGNDNQYLQDCSFLCFRYNKWKPIGFRKLILLYYG